MERNLVIVTSEKSFYGSLDGLPPHISQMIARVFYEPEITDAVPYVRSSSPRLVSSMLISRPRGSKADWM